MPRRASSGISTNQIIGLALAVVAVCAFGYLFVRTLSKSESSGTSRRATELSVSEYLENANSLRGNVYSVTGVIEDQLKWTPNNGRLFSVVAEQGGETTPLPIIVPQDFSKTNIDRGSEFRFLVEVGRDGTLIARDVSKI